MIHKFDYPLLNPTMAILNMWHLYDIIASQRVWGEMGCLLFP